MPRHSLHPFQAPHHARPRSRQPLYRQLRRLGVIGSLSLLAACQTPPSSDTATSPATDTPATDEQPVAADGPLKLGTLLPVTGDLAQYGVPMQDAAQLLVDQANSCEGVFGQPITLVTEDTQTEPSRGAAAATKLTEVDRVTGIVGAASSAISTAAIDISVRNQVVQISPASTSPVFTERAAQGDFKEFWYRTAPSDALQGPAIALLAETQGIETMAVLAINNDYGNGLATALIPAFESLGGTVVNNGQAVFYPPDAATFDSEVSAAFAEQPDAIVLIAYPETGSLVLKSAFEQGFLDGETQIMLTDGMKTDKIAELVGQDAAGQFIVAGAIGTAPQAGGPALENFNALYVSTNNREPEVFDPNTWDAAALLVLAAEAAGSNSGAAIRENVLAVANAPGEEVSDICEALGLVREGQDINYQGASSDVELDALGDVAGSYEVWTVDDAGALTVTDTITVSGN